MRFALRSLIGLALFVSAIGVGVYGVMTARDALSERNQRTARLAPQTERVFAVETGWIEVGVVRPQITAFGEIRSWRTLELRASAGGYLVELSEMFRDGVEVDGGEFLFRIDPKDYAAREADARAAVAEAEAEVAEARQTVKVARQELWAAETQRDLRSSALERRRGLLSRGVSTATEVEDAEMAFAASEQTVAGRAQSVLAAEIRIERSVLSLQRAEIALEEARRTLDETEHRAPFGGLLSDVTAVLGALATPNERLGLLIDPQALEAVFRLTNAQYARLIDERGALRRTPLSVTLELDDIPLTIPGVLDRAGAMIGDGETGRLVYAKLDLDVATLLRPGDFVSVSIDEKALENVALLPSRAVGETGKLLIVGEDDRLRETAVRILRRQGDEVIVADAPHGARYVRSRAPQLGAGVKVRPLRDDEAGNEPKVADGGLLITLDMERRRRLIEFVQSDSAMAADAKDRLLTTLRAGSAPAQLIESLESRMGNAG